MIRTVAKYRKILSGVENVRIRFSYSMIYGFRLGVGDIFFQIGKITKNKIKSNKKLFDHSQLRRIVCSLKTCDWNANNQIEKNVNFVIE